MEDPKHKVALQLKERYKEFERCYEARDHYGQAKLFTVDAKTYHPGQPVQMGRQAVATGARLSHETYGIKKVKYELDQVQIVLPGAAIVTAFSDCMDEDGKVVSKFKNLDIWKNINGEWYVGLGIYNAIG